MTLMAIDWGVKRTVLTVLVIAGIYVPAVYLGMPLLVHAEDQAAAPVPAGHGQVEKEVDAMELQPGDRILVGPGRIETVAAPTETDQYGGCAIHTEEHRILTGLPCNVKVIWEGG